ncbi:spore germination protein [Bacillus sp. T3]|uniref:spore germination protein n=1 Tax=Bacillus sp. T3 TaxID=467262 RepID=UPI0029829952|nr:spore germination protein [Bacillus sp. T3]
MFGQVTLRNTHRHFDEQKDSTPLSSSFQKNIEILTTLFDGCDDLIIHHTEIGSFSGCFLFLQGLVKQQALYEIEQRLALHTEFPTSQDDLPSFIRKQFTLSTIMEALTFHDVSTQILTGNTVLLLNEYEKAFVFHSSNDHGRIVSSPNSERTVRGPQEGFVEDIEKNLSLIRRKIKTHSLKVEHLTIGEQTNTQISVVYMKGIANEDIVKEVHKRLSRIKIDGILDSHYVESMIKDAPKSPGTNCAKHRTTRSCMRWLTRREGGHSC